MVSGIEWLEWATSSSCMVADVDKKRREKRKMFWRQSSVVKKQPTILRQSCLAQTLDALPSAFGLCTSLHATSNYPDYMASTTDFSLPSFPKSSVYSSTPYTTIFPSPLLP